jgi:hypothetical protein
LDWISEVKYTTDHETVQSLRAENTCTRLIGSKQFDEWQAATESSILWLRGDVGTGKSVLSSNVVDYLQKVYATSIEDGGLAFFYCNRQIEDRKTSTLILRTLVRQLCTTYRSEDDIRPELRAACIERKKKAGHLDAKACEAQILASIDLYPRTVIVLDGLDECSENDRKVLLATISNLVSNSNKAFKIYIASRPTVDIEKAIHKLPHIEISSEWNTQRDIKTYVEQAIDGHENWNDEDIFQISPDTKKLIVDTLSGETFKNRPMFRWAHLQLQQLFPKKSDKDIRARLGKLPKDLDESYTEIYENNTKDLGEEEKAHVDRAFMWVMCSKYPMPRDRLLDAICMTPLGTRDEGEVKVKALLQLCQHLLVVGTAWYDQDWRFPHASVAEYFEQKHWTMAVAHSYVARVCLSQMMSFYETFDPAGLKERRLFDDKREEYTAIDYVRYCWHYHVQEAQAHSTATMSIDEDMRTQLKGFLGSPMKSSTQFQRWIMHAERTFDGDKMARHLDYSGLRHMLPSTMSLFTMIHFDFTTSLSDWWESADMDVSAINVMGETPLAVSRSIEISGLLLKRGTDVNQGFMWRSFNNEPFEPRYNVLTAAVGLVGLPDNGLPMVQLLVQAGAEVDKVSPDQPDNNALNKAVSLRLVDTMEYLVEDAKADVNVELPKTSVLITAASGGVVDIIRYLVSKGADVAKLVPNSPAGTPLASAAFSGHLEVVKLFIEEFKVDSNQLLAHRAYGSVLASASSVEIVRYLVKDAGVDANLPLKHGNYGSALASHAAYGHLDIVKYLIEEGGADPKMVLEGRKHRTALEAAKASGEFARDVVEYLDPSAKRLRINTGSMSGLRKDSGIRRLAKRGTFGGNAFNPLEEATPLTPVGGLGIRKLPKRGSF